MISRMLYILPLFAPAYQGVENNYFALIDICCLFLYPELSHIEVCVVSCMQRFCLRFHSKKSTSLFQVLLLLTGVTPVS